MADVGGGLWGDVTKRRERTGVEMKKKRNPAGEDSLMGSGGKDNEGFQTNEQVGLHILQGLFCHSRNLCYKFFCW